MPVNLFNRASCNLFVALAHRSAMSRFDCSPRRWELLWSKKEERTTWSRGSRTHLSLLPSMTRLKACLTQNCSSGEHPIRLAAKGCNFLHKSVQPKTADFKFIHHMHAVHSLGCIWEGEGDAASTYCANVPCFISECFIGCCTHNGDAVMACRAGLLNVPLLEMIDRYTFSTMCVPDTWPLTSNLWQETCMCGCSYVLKPSVTFSCVEECHLGCILHVTPPKIITSIDLTM